MYYHTLSITDFLEPHILNKAFKYSPLIIKPERDDKKLKNH